MAVGGSQSGCCGGRRSGGGSSGDSGGGRSERMWIHRTEPRLGRCEGRSVGCGGGLAPHKHLGHALRELAVSRCARAATVIMWQEGVDCRHQRWPLRRGRGCGSGRSGGGLGGGLGAGGGCVASDIADAGLRCLLLTHDGEVAIEHRRGELCKCAEVCVRRQCVRLGEGAHGKPQRVRVAVLLPRREVSSTGKRVVASQLK
mmetsp:Transcript_54596/g.119080  ORF Transcript_54596/g.119080 Transcript_54596/m.119080 type:complete len:201 (-) Transcript_54596:739-1341(-)